MNSGLSESETAGATLQPARSGMLGAFWRTKRAIKRGEPLYDWTNAELEAGGYMTPLRFNIIESLLSAVPGLFVMLGLFMVLQPILIEQAGMEVDTALLYKNLILLCVLMSVYLLAPPAFTGVLAPFAGAGSIRIEDRTPALKTRATRAYLFMDGAYGLYTQSVLALGIVTLSWVGINGEQPVVLAVSMVMSIALIVAAFHQLYLTCSKIPKLMFAANGYSARVRRFWQKKLPDDPPWNRYTLYVFAGGFFSGILIGLLFAACEKVILPLMG